MSLLSSTHPTSSCIHRVEKESFEVMTQRKSLVYCPFPGCKGQWNSKHIIEDKEFARKIQEFVSRPKATAKKMKEMSTIIDLTI